MNITLNLNVGPLQQIIAAHRSKVRSAMIRTASKTADDVKTALQAEMKAKFFRPTNFILNSLQVEWARRDKPEALVSVRRFGVRGVPIEQALKAQVFGGTRPQKRSEIRLQGLGPGGGPLYMMPARFAQYDANGNPSRGELTIILSQLGVLNRGDNRAARTGKRRRKARIEYFAIWGRGEGLTAMGNALNPGIYRRNAAGRALPVYFFMKGQPRYRVRLDWFGVARTTAAQKAAANFRAELARGSEQAPVPASAPPIAA